MSVTYSGNSSCCASCRGHKKIHGSPYSKLTSNVDSASIGVYTCRVSCFPFFWHVLQLKVAHVLSCLSKNIQRSYKPSLCPSNVKKSKARVRELRWFSVLWSVAGEKAGNTKQNSVKYPRLSQIKARSGKN